MPNGLISSENSLPEQIAKPNEPSRNTNWFIHLINGIVRIFRPEKRCRVIKLKQKELTKDRYTETKIIYKDKY